MEVAIGFHTLALIHFAGNAFLRTYQLLVSPSVLSYLVHNMFFNIKASASREKESSFRKIKNSIYILSVKEWNLDFLLHHFLWKPFKWFGNKFGFLSGKIYFKEGQTKSRLIAVAITIIGIIFLAFS